MRKSLPLLCLLASAGVFFACGELSSSQPQKLSALAAQSQSHSQSLELLDNDPIKLHCWGMSQKAKSPVPVGYDDQADVRVCVALQKDGHVGIDLRYRPDLAGTTGAFARFKLRDGAGEEAEELFPLSPQRLSQSFDVYLSSGCVVGGIFGCVTASSEQMSELFRPLLLAGDSTSYGPFTLEISLLDVQGGKTLRPHSAFGQSYRLRVPAL